MDLPTIKNHIGGQWLTSQSTNALDVRNPATDEVLAHVPLSTADEVQAAVGRGACCF